MTVAVADLSRISKIYAIIFTYLRRIREKHKGNKEEKIT